MGKEIEKIKVIDGCYHAYRVATQSYEQISDFTINLKHIEFYRSEWRRQITLLSDGIETEPFTLETEKMISAHAFKNLVLKKGEYTFKGTTDDFEEIWNMEKLKNKDTPIVELIDEVGYIKDQSTWLFDNLAIKDKKLIIPDDNGIFWLEKGDGLEILPLSYGRQMPKLEEPEAGYNLSEQLKLFEDTLNKNLGGYKGSLLIGYIVATIYSRCFFWKYNCFPILFVYGKYESGKNIFCELIVKFFGLNQEFATNIQESTQTGISRLLNYYSYLPVWIDEYRNSDKVRAMSSFFRDVYNKVSPIKAKKEDFGTRDVKLKGNLILSGEEMPIDNALRSRCIPVILTSKERDDSLYSQVLRLSKNFSKITFSLIKKFDREKRREYLKIATQLREYFISENIKPRQAENFAAVVAGRKFLDKLISYDEDFEKWVLSLVKKENKRTEEESPVTVFWETIEALISKEEIKKSNYIGLDKKTGLIYVWFAGLFREYEKDIRFRKNISFRSRQTILDQMSEESYFIAKNKSKRINGQIRTCIMLNYDKCPKNIRAMAGSSDKPIF